MGKKQSITGLDFETSIGENGECMLEYVALSNDKYERVYNLRNSVELITFIISILTSGETYVVFNASFDVEIIMTLLLQNGYTFITTEKPSHKTMKLLSSQKIYKLTVYTKVWNKLVTTSFIDLGNIIVGSNLRDIAENYTEYHKGSYEETKDNETEFKEYNLLDARITKEAYKTITKELGKNCITIGSAAFSIMLDESFPNMSKDKQIKQFKNVYGKLTLEDDKYLRQFYRGGFGWCSVDHRWTGHINSWDKKSAYPYECIGKQLPTYNGALKFSGYHEPTADYPFAFITMIVNGQVRVNYCPVLPSRTPYGDSNTYIYRDQVVNIIQIYGEKSEYDYFMENVEIDDVEYIETLLLPVAISNPLEKFMQKYYNIKEESSGIRRDVAKRLINSLTGKLGTNPIKHNITYKLEDGILKRELFEETDSETYATHVVSVITSRVRCEMYRVDALLRDKCEFRLYATDSCKHSTETEVIEQKTGIGQWNEEYHDVDFIYVGLKTYMFDPYNEKGVRNVVCSGISRDKKQLIKPEDFYSGNEVESLISIRSVNGRIILDGTKKIATSPEKPRRKEQIKDVKK